MAVAERKGPIVVTVSQGVRVQNAVKRIEGNYAPDQRRGRVVPWNPGIMRAKCTTAIPAGTFDTPSDTGEVQVYHKDASGAWAASGDPVQCFNQFPFGDDVAVGDGCLVAWIGGEIWYVNSDCPGG